MKLLREVKGLTPEVLPPLVSAADNRVREGRFQRWLALIAGLSSILAGLEVSYEHYRGSYSRRIMYTPVILSSALAGAGVWGFFSRWAATRMLRLVSAITLIDAVTGFVFHVRGVQRKPGGWRLPVNNIIMGPPVFAPLLFGVSGYLGLIASFLRRGSTEKPGERRLLPAPRARQTLGRPAGASAPAHRMDAGYSRGKVSEPLSRRDRNLGLLQRV